MSDFYDEVRPCDVPQFAEFLLNLLEQARRGRFWDKIPIRYILAGCWASPGRGVPGRPMVRIAMNPNAATLIAVPSHAGVSSAMSVKPTSAADRSVCRPNAQAERPAQPIRSSLLFGGHRGCTHAVPSGFGRTIVCR